MSYQFSELTSDELEGILEVAEAVQVVGKLLIERHVVETGATVDQRDLCDAVITEMTRRAHVDAAIRLGRAL